MSMSLHNNISALNATTALIVTNRQLQSSLAKLSSGYKINKAGDDASGMVIANSLRAQAKGLGQAINNANDAVGVIKIADNAMEEQISIIDTIRQKAIQSSQDSQTTNSRKALQEDVVRLLEELDNIANSTSFNGISLLSGSFQNKKFQIGAYSNQTVDTSIAGTNSNKIGQTRFATGATINKPTDISLKFLDVNGIDDIEIESVVISTSAGTGLGTLTEAINKYANELHIIRASYNVLMTGARPVGASNQVGNANTITGFTINGINLGSFNNIKSSDADSKVVAAINYYSSDTGVKASVDSRGHLELVSDDGRGIHISADEGFNLLGFDGEAKADGSKGREKEFYGRLTLVRNNASYISVNSKTTNDTTWVDNAPAIGFSKSKMASSIINLRNVTGGYSIEQACAMGSYPNGFVSTLPANNVQGNQKYSMGAGLTTYHGAQAVIDITDTALKMLGRIRADLGSTQIQLEATVRNIATTKTNVKFSESQIRDTDYAEEIQKFTQKSALVTAGNYTLNQANESLKNIERLLQY